MNPKTMRAVVPTLFTVGALVAGFLSIIQSALGQFQMAAQLIMLSLILDGIDGKLARALKASTPFGAELDTFVDYLSFGVAPALLAYLAALHEMGTVGFLLPILLAVSGAMRLSRFRTADPQRGQGGFTGLPITVAGGWIAMAVYLDRSDWLFFEEFSLQRGPVAAVVWGSSLVFGLLQVSNVRYPKSSKNALVFSCGLIAVLLLFSGLNAGAVAAATAMVYGFGYAFLTPVLSMAARHRAQVSARRQAAASLLASEEDEEEDDEEEEVPFTFRRP